MIELGGNIKLVGFKDLEPAKLVVVKKIVGNAAKKISTREAFDELNLHLKDIGTKKKEIKVKLVRGGNIKNAEIVDYNLFYALSTVLSKVQ